VKYELPDAALPLPYSSDPYIRPALDNDLDKEWYGGAIIDGTDQTIPRTRETEPDIVVGILGGVVVALSRAAIPGVVVPGAPPDDTVRARYGHYANSSFP
jgi:hypothetical protein